jgi:hypothetical protein
MLEILQFQMTMTWIPPLDPCNSCQAVSRDREVWSKWHLLRLQAACAAMGVMMVKRPRLKSRMVSGAWRRRLVSMEGMEKTLEHGKEEHRVVLPMVK